ncbi:MAG: hypothetical protein ABIN04_15250 [Ginsengibacter sp.]
MSYKEELPEFMAKSYVNYVNKRFDITQAQYDKLREIEDELKIPSSAIVRLAINCFLPKLRDQGFTYGGIRELWDRSKF